MNQTKTIYVVFKTHFDIGFTELASEVIRRYGRKMLPDVISTCKETQRLGRDHQFVWTMSAWPLVQSLSPEVADSGDVAEAQPLLRSGQIAWHMLPYTTHTEFCGLEEYIRGFRFSRDLSSQYGFWPISAKMTDVPGHTWVLPTLLAKAGIKFLHLGCNPGCMPPDVPRLFFWEGPDGSRVLTFYNKGYYGSSLVPPEGWDYPVWLALMQTNDNAGPQGAEAVEGILETVREKVPGANVVVGTMDDFYRALSDYPLDNIPVVRGDLADTWIHGVGTYPREVSALRRLRSATTEAEKAMSVQALLQTMGGKTEEALQAVFDRIFELSLLFGEHTWGLDVKSTLKQRYYEKREFLAHKQDPEVLRIEQSWEEQRSRVLDAKKLLDGIKPQIMDGLAGSVAVAGSRMVAFNGVGWQRGAWIDASALNAGAGETVVDAETGEACPMVRCDGKTEVFVSELPAFGWKTLKLGSSAPKALPLVSADAKAGTLENQWFRIRADAATGSIISLTEKETGREWVDAGAGFGIGQYRYDVYGIEDVTEFIRSYAYRFSDWLICDLGRVGYPEVGHAAFFAKDFTVTARQDGRSAALCMTASIAGQSVLEYGNALSVETCVTLYADDPVVDLTVRLLGKQETPFIESGHVVMPFNLKNHSVRINKLGSVLDPQTDIVRDANHGLFCCENWVDMTDGEAGMAVVPFDMPLFSFGEPAIYKYQREPAPKPPELYFNLFNNSWGTNFPQWMGGDFSFRYRLIPHKGDWQEGRVQQKALEGITPVLTGFAQGPGGTLPATHSTFEIPGGTAVTALKPAYDGTGHVLRLRELEGRGSMEKVDSAAPVRITGECDLLDRPLEASSEQTGNLAINQFEIKSLKIE